MDCHGSRAFGRSDLVQIRVLFLQSTEVLRKLDDERSAEYCPNPPLRGRSQLGRVSSPTMCPSALIFRVSSREGWTKQMRPMGTKTFAKDKTQSVLFSEVWPEAFLCSVGGESDATKPKGFCLKNRFPGFRDKTRCTADVEPPQPQASACG